MTINAAKKSTTTQIYTCVKHINMYIPPYTKIYTGSEIVKACYEGQHHEKGPTIVQVEREIHGVRTQGGDFR